MIVLANRILKRSRSSDQLFGPADNLHSEIVTSCKRPTSLSVCLSTSVESLPDMEMTAKVDILDDAPRPRLCHLKKQNPQDGYGFNLHAEQGRAGHFIGHVDADSIAEAAGLRDGDRIVEVNGVNVVGDSHAHVVERIRRQPNESTFLVVDQLADRYYMNKKITISSDLPNLLELRTPPREKSQAKKYGAGTGMNPRICHLKTWPNFIGFGFTIQADRDKLNPVVSEVDPESPAEYGGVKKGDKLVEVNDQPIEADADHRELVRVIKNHPEKVKLLVIERENYRKFISLRSQGQYADELIEVITCPDDDPRGHENNVVFNFDPSGSSLSSNVDLPHSSSNGKQQPAHSTPVNRPNSWNSNSSSNNSNNDAAVATSSHPVAAAATTTADDDHHHHHKRSSKVRHPHYSISMKYCEVISTNRDLGFGFNLVADRTKPGNYLDKVEPMAPASLVGLTDGDYLITVNDSLVVRDSHVKVVQKIKASPYLLKLVVTDRLGFLQLYEMSDEEIETMVMKTVVFDSSKSFADSTANNSALNELSIHQKTLEDDNASIDYRQVAEEMVQLALQEADQDNMRLDQASNGIGRSTSNPTNLPSSARLSPTLSSRSVDRSLSNSSQPQQKPSGPVVVGGLEFASSAQEARMRMKKKTNVKNISMSAKDKYELLKQL